MNIWTVEDYIAAEKRLNEIWPLVEEYKILEQAVLRYELAQLYHSKKDGKNELSEPLENIATKS